MNIYIYIYYQLSIDNWKQSLEAGKMWNIFPWNVTESTKPPCINPWKKTQNK